MTISSNTNNFGHTEAVSFKAFLSSDMVVLNGRFTVDTTSAEYAAAGILEITLPDLTLSKSAVAYAYIRGVETVDYGSFSSAYAIGTVVKTWIGEGGKLCIEKFSHYDDLGEYELLFCTMFAGKGYRGSVSNFAQTALTFNYETSVTLNPSEKVCIIAEGWCFLHFFYGSYAGDFFRQAIKAAVAGLPTDICADIYLVGGGQQSGHKGCWVAEARIEDGTFSVPEPSPTSANTGADPFVFAFLVRDGVAESTDSSDGSDNTDGAGNSETSSEFSE